MKTGIVSYGAYIPRTRIEPAEIGRVWGIDGAAMGKGLMVQRKSVPMPDEDTITISVQAARDMMLRANADPEEIGAIFVGSESHPYAVKPTSTIVAEAIGAAPHLTAADYEFACKAGTAAIQTSMGLVGSEMMRYSVAIGADTSQGAPGDALEYTAAAGGAAYLIGTEKEKLIAVINQTYSFTTDTPDFWRREGQMYPSHGGRFTGEPAYFKHVVTAGKTLMEKAGTRPEDYNHVILHQPNGKFPTRAGKQMGFVPEQLKYGLLTPEIGNTYSGAVMLGLSSVLDVAKPGDRILMVAFGSGAGSDAFDITVTDEIENFPREKGTAVRKMIDNYTLIDYSTYAKYRGKIKMRE